MAVIGFSAQRNRSDMFDGEWRRLAIVHSDVDIRIAPREAGSIRASQDHSNHIWHNTQAFDYIRQGASLVRWQIRWLIHHPSSSRFPLGSASRR